MARLSISGEPRSERVALLVTRSTQRDLAKVAMVQRTSVNELINIAVAAYLEQHQGDIKRYNDFFGEE